MLGLCFFGWFVCGLIAVHIGVAHDLADGEVFTDPSVVWLAMFGPITLLIVLVFCVQKATRKVNQ